MKSLYPKHFSRFYDTIYTHHPLSEQNDFYLNEIKKSSGPVLEVGVGTGRHYIDGLNSGADIYGIDISGWMLEVLKSKLNKDQHFRISNQNIIDFKFDMKFDLIIAPFRVFMHLLEKEDQLHALNNVYSHLKPGGKFIFDVFVPDLNQLISGIKDFVDFDQEYEPGKKLKRSTSTQPDIINQIIKVFFTLEWNDDEGKHVEKFNTPMRFFFRYELEHLVERSRFESYEIKGDFKGSKLDGDSKEFIMHCFKS
jgi:SAM-dependent methyltransferase